jgi:hypothetical protein
VPAAQFAGLVGTCAIERTDGGFTPPAGLASGGLAPGVLARDRRAFGTPALMCHAACRASASSPADVHQFCVAVVVGEHQGDLKAVGLG